MTHDHRSQPISSSVLAAIRSSMTGSSRLFDSNQPPGSKPFITITRALGADHPSLLPQLMAQLNLLNPNPPWLSYDRELIEQVSRDHGLSQTLIHALENHPHSILDDFLASLRSDRARPTDQAVYAKVVATIRTLAMGGRAVLIGRGGVFCTQDLIGGVHVQFVAPTETRIRRIMQTEQLSHARAQVMLEKADAQRDAFFDRFWSTQRHRDALFTLTINSAAVPLEVQVSAIAQTVMSRQFQVHVDAAPQITR